ncbi:unnamed protein product, partial [Polarella glacialis]
ATLVHPEHRVQILARPSRSSALLALSASRLSGVERPARSPASRAARALGRLGEALPTSPPASLAPRAASVQLAPETCRRARF